MKCLVVTCEREATDTVSLRPGAKPDLCAPCKHRLLALGWGTDPRQGVLL